MNPLEWEETNDGCRSYEYEIKFVEFDICQLWELYWRNCYINSFDTLDEAKAAAQKWEDEHGT